MKLIVVPFTKRDPKPRNVFATTGVVLLDILGFATNHANRVLRCEVFHDRPPIGV
jgi:hypothetical protein